MTMGSCIYGAFNFLEDPDSSREANFIMAKKVELPFNTKSKTKTSDCKYG